MNVLSVLYPLLFFKLCSAFWPFSSPKEVVQKFVLDISNPDISKVNMVAGTKSGSDCKVFTKSTHMIVSVVDGQSPIWRSANNKKECRLATYCKKGGRHVLYLNFREGDNIRVPPQSFEKLNGKWKAITKYAFTCKLTEMVGPDTEEKASKEHIIHAEKASKEHIIHAEMAHKDTTPCSLDISMPFEKIENITIMEEGPNSKHFAYSPNSGFHIASVSDSNIPLWVAEGSEECTVAEVYLKPNAILLCLHIRADNYNHHLHFVGQNGSWDLVQQPKFLKLLSESQQKNALRK